MKQVQIGDALLFNADCRDLLAAGAFAGIGAIVSDPPYGIGYQHSGGNRSVFDSAARGYALQSKRDTITGDDEPFDPRPWIAAAPNARADNPRQRDACLIVLWGADHFRARLPDGGTLLAWDKHLGVASDDSFADCEWAWCGRDVRREVFRWLWKGICTQKSALDIQTTPATERTSGKVFARVHVSQKPVELMRWCIDKVRPLAGKPVLDPYMGSGSTAIAALSLGLPFIGCEVDPDHFETACARVRMFVDGRQPAPMPLFDPA